jgi:hypothetical protein
MCEHYLSSKSKFGSTVEIAQASKSVCDFRLPRKDLSCGIVWKKDGIDVTMFANRLQQSYLSFPRSSLVILRNIERQSSSMQQLRNILLVIL